MLLSKAIPNDTVCGGSDSCGKRPASDFAALAGEEVVFSLVLEQLVLGFAEEVSIEWTVAKKSGNKAAITPCRFHPLFALETLDEIGEWDVVDNRREGQDLRAVVIQRFDEKRQ